MTEETLDQYIEPENQEISLDIENDNDIIQALEEKKINFSQIPKEKRHIVRNNIISKMITEAEIEGNEKKLFALNNGWSPQIIDGGKNKDGSERRFKDYEEFTDTIRENAPVMNERLKSIAKENEEIRKEMAKVSAIAKMNLERSIQNDEQSLDNQIKEAREYGDFDRYDTLILKKQELIKGKLKLKEYEPEIQQNPTIDPQIQKDLEIWGAKNIWYHSDFEMQNYAKQQAEILNKNYPNIPFKERLDKITELTKTFFPEKFTQQPSKPLVLASKNAGTFNSNKKSELTFSQLPDIEKNQARQAIRIGVFKDEVDYMKTHNQIIKNNA